MDDQRILKLYEERSEQAISETADKYGRYCYSIAFRILNNDEDSKECINDTYLRAWNTIPPNRPRYLRTFLGKITRNLALNRYEKQTADKRGNGQIPLILEELQECLPGTANVDISESLVIRMALDRFLNDLPDKTRKLFVLRYWYMHSVQEIAKEYDLTPNDVSVVLFRARQKLKTILEQEDIPL